jgi:hypothetical protein
MMLQFITTHPGWTLLFIIFGLDGIRCIVAECKR